MNFSGIKGGYGRTDDDCGCEVEAEPEPEGIILLAVLNADDYVDRSNENTWILQVGLFYFYFICFLSFYFSTYFYLSLF